MRSLVLLVVAGGMTCALAFACGSSSSNDAPAGSDGGPPNPPPTPPPNPPPPGPPADAGSDGGTTGLSGSCSPDGWCWAAPQPFGNDLDAIWRASDGTLFAAGSAGTIMRKTPAGWTIDLVGDDASLLLSVWGSGPDDVYAVGKSQLTGGASTQTGIFHFSGGTWSSVSSPLTYPRAVWGSSASDVYIAGLQGVVHATGGAFASIASFPTSADYRLVWGTGPSDVWVIGATSGVTGGTTPMVALHWDGVSWTSGNVGTGGNYPESIWGSASNDVYIAGHGVDGGISQLLYHWDGVSWTAVSAASSAGAFGYADVNGVDASHMFLVSRGGFYNYPTWSVFTYDGVAKSPLAEIKPSFLDTEALVGPGEFPAPHVWAASPTDVTLVGPRGRLGHWDGAAWTSQQGEPDRGTFLSTYVESPTDVWALAQTYSAGQFLTEYWHYDGATWTHGGVGQYLVAIWASGPDDAYAVGQDYIDHWDGKTWTLLKRTGQRQAVWGTGPSDVYTGGSGGLDHWNGSSWTTITGVNVPSSPMSLWGTGASDIWALGSSGSASHYDGMTWTSTTVGGGAGYVVSTIWGSSSSDIYVANGGLHHYDGMTWSNVTLPAGATVTAVGGRAGDVYAAGFGHVYHGSGTSGWTAQRVGSDQYTYSLSGAAAGTTVAAGDHGILLKK